jgi:nucleoside-diphosphate-sugar epimerase
MPLQRIALIGANGTLGPAVLCALLSAQRFTITVLTRQSSKSTYAPPVTEIRISDSLPTDELVNALTGQDALVTTFAGSNADLQIRLADACVAAGVQRFVPADFGSCDSENPRALQLIPLYRGKKRVRAHLVGLVGRSGGRFSWTSVVCGHFFDWGLMGGLLSFDLKNRKVRVFDGGDIKWSASTLGRVGESVVAVLMKEEETRDRVCFVQSFCVSQNEVLACLERVMGEKWEVEQVKSEEFIREMKGKLDRDPDDGEAREALVSVVGIVESNWEGKEGFANGMLGLQEEDLEGVVRRVVKDL